MLLPDNINPENSIYYNGALVLNELQHIGENEYFWTYILKFLKVKRMSFFYIHSMFGLALYNQCCTIEGEEVILCL